VSSSNILPTHLCVGGCGVCVCVCVVGCVCVCVCVVGCECVCVWWGGFCWLVQTNLWEGCSPISRLKFWNKIWMSIWREALSTCNESLTSDLVAAGGSAERTASCSDVFSPGENT